MITQIHGNHVVVFTAEPEDIPVVDWVTCPKDLRSLRGKLERGTLIHFCAKATIYGSDGQEIASDYLGNCYYKSLREFVETPNCYAADMVANVLAQVNDADPNLNHWAGEERFNYGNEQ